MDYNAYSSEEKGYEGMYRWAENWISTFQCKNTEQGQAQAGGLFQMEKASPYGDE